MRIDPSIHVGRNWLVHDIADDFDLLDVWRLPVEGSSPQRDFAALLELMDSAQGEPTSGVAGWLFAIRSWLGGVFGWDDERHLPIPGCSETSLVERLPTEHRAAAPAFDPASEFQTVYRGEREAILELSNSTVHAIMHLGWVVEGSVEESVGHGEMAVYSKPRGWFGRAYMAAITPFRLYLVYPALIRHIRARWARVHREEKS